MAPTAIKAEVDGQQVDVANLKVKTVNQHKEIEVESPDEKDPVAPNFMYDFKYNTPLPTFDREGRDFPADTDAPAIVNEFVENQLAPALQSGDGKAFAGLFFEKGKWPFKINAGRIIELTVICRYLA